MNLPGSGRPSISVVIPVYNEGTHIELVLDAIRKELDNIGETGEIIIVDDSSEDNTWQILEETAAQTPSVLRNTVVSFSDPKAAPATTNPTVAVSGFL